MKSSVTSAARRVLAAAVLQSLIGVAAAPALAAPPESDRVFPDATVAYLSITNADDFHAKWDQTQIGQFSNDASAKPFMDYLRGRVIDRFGNIEQRLGMTIDDVTAAASGEVGVGMIHHRGERANIALLVDTTGSADEADALVAKAEAQLTSRGGRRTTLTRGGVELVAFAMPDKQGDELDVVAGRTIAYFRSGELLVAVDSIDDAKAMIDRIGGAGGALAGVKEYTETMSRCQAESRGVGADVRWFINPFAWDAARRTLRVTEGLADRKDTFTILGEQGFDAVRGVGGHISLAVTKQQDIIHRTAIYAPPKPGTERRTAKDKYDLAMRMLELPNRADLPIEKWAPRMTASYTTFNGDLLNAFDHVESLFDAMSGHDGSFANAISSFEDDPYGPEINVRGEVVKNLGKRVTVMTDYKLPITPECERYLFVVEVKNPDLLRSPVDKLMEHDGALRRQVNGVPFWEIVPEEEITTGADLGDGLLSVDDTGAEAEERERVLRRAAVCLHESTLIIASDVEFLEQVLFGIEGRESLKGSLDYQEAMRQLARLAPKERCSWSFLRTDESIRPSYELIRQGLMPQAQTFFGRLLNELLTTREDEERGIVRKQRIDGSTLPTFELARRYFGPAARAIRTDDDGWFVTGVVLSKAGQ